MIIHDLREHLARKKAQESDEAQQQYRLKLSEAVLATVAELTRAHGHHSQRGDRAAADRDQMALMTIFALTEEIPWFGTEGLSQKAVENFQAQVSTAAQAVLETKVTDDGEEPNDVG